jgi:hypothetical protein
LTRSPYLDRAVDIAFAQLKIGIGEHLEQRGAVGESNSGHAIGAAGEHRFAVPQRHAHGRVAQRAQQAPQQAAFQAQPRRRRAGVYRLSCRPPVRLEEPCVA